MYIRRTAEGGRSIFPLACADLLIKEGVKDASNAEDCDLLAARFKRKIFSRTYGRTDGGQDNAGAAVVDAKRVGARATDLAVAGEMFERFREREVRKSFGTLARKQAPGPGGFLAG